MTDVETKLLASVQMTQEALAAARKDPATSGRPKLIKALIHLDHALSTVNLYYQLNHLTPKEVVEELVKQNPGLAEEHLESR